MLRFFRHIRQRLLTDNKFSKYLLYAIGEILLVVIGILIALQIDTWNENQKSDAKAQGYYIQLLEDLNSDIVFAKSMIKDYHNYLKEYEEYTNSFTNDQLTPDAVYDRLSALALGNPPLVFNSSTVETLQSSGEIGLIPLGIRNRLIDIKRLQNEMIERNDVGMDAQIGLIQDINRYAGSTTLPKRLLNQPKISGYLNIDNNVRELILLYEGVHRWKSITISMINTLLEEMLMDIDTIIALINAELKK
jgi:hypothetical protein